MLRSFEQLRRHNGAGVLLGSAEKSDANFFQAAAVANTVYPIEGVELDVAVVDRPVLVRFGASDIWTAGAAGLLLLTCYVDDVQRGLIRGQSTVANQRVPLGAYELLLDEPGEYTVDVRAVASVAGNLTVAANANGPIYLRAVTG